MYSQRVLVELSRFCFRRHGIKKAASDTLCYVESVFASIMMTYPQQTSSTAWALGMRLSSETSLDALQCSMY